MLKLMWVDEKPMWIPVTEQEDAERVAMIEAVRNIPEIMPEQIADNAGYIGKHAENVSVYDAMLAEIYAEHDGEKARVRNRRRADRKHKLTPKMRKEQEWMRNMHICNRYIGWGWDLLDNAKAESAEKIARADWELEQDEIAEDRDYAELEEEYREWERRYRHEKYMRNLNEWLKYA